MRVRTIVGSRAFQWTILSTVALWGLYQCFWNLHAANLGADEPIYTTAGWEYVHGVFTANREHPPTAKYIIGVAQLVLGQGVLAGRIAAAVAAFLGGVVLYLWLRKEIGWVGGLVAAALTWLLPRGVASGVRIDRFATLEPFMVFFAIVAMAAAWAWYRKQSWPWLVISAVAMALSVTSKVSTAAILPAFLLLPLLNRKWRAGLLAGLLFSAVFAVTFVLLYLPMGIRSAITYMLQMQSRHDIDGHVVVVAGVATAHPPWWANLLFSVDGIGIPAAIVLVVGALAALWAKRASLVAYLGLALGLLFVFYLGIAKVALSYYYYAWVWVFCALAAIGIVGLLARKTVRWLGIATRSLAVCLLVVAGGTGVWVSIAVWNERPAGMALVDAELDSLGRPDGDVLVAGMADWEYLPYLDGHETTDPADADIVAVAVKHSPRFPLDPKLVAELSEDADEYTHVVLDDVDLYVRDE